MKSKSKSPRRLDGRRADQLRPPFLEFGVVSRAQGSALFGTTTFGGPRVLAAVYSGNFADSTTSKTDIEVQVTSPGAQPAAQGPKVEDKQLEQQLKSIAARVVLPGNGPLRIFVHQVAVVRAATTAEEDPSWSPATSAAANNAVALALLDAGVPMRCVPMAVGVGAAGAGPLNIDDDLSEDEEEEIARKRRRIESSAGDAGGGGGATSLRYNSTGVQRGDATDNPAKNKAPRGNSGGGALKRRRRAEKSFFVLDPSEDLESGMGGAWYAFDQHGNTLHSSENWDEEVVVEGEEEESESLARGGAVPLFTFVRKSLEQS